MSLLDLASLVLAPTATKEGKVYSAIPDTGEGDMTFTRGSSATRVNSAGLIEKERSNLLLQSNTFNTTWINNNSTETSGQTGYDGSSDAWLLTANSTSNVYVYQSNSTNSVVTFSVYAKSNTANFLELVTIGGGGANPRAWFNLSTGSVGTSYNVIDTKIEIITNGWYRCSITLNGSIYQYRIYASDSDNSTTITNGNNIYIQDAMLNEGLVAQSYIETTTSAVYEGITDDVPRVDYSGGGCPALKLEPQRTNVVTNSEYVSSSDYVTGNWTGTITTNTSETLSPEGLYNATKFVKSGSTDRVYFQTSVSDGTYTGSMYFKAVSGQEGNTVEISVRRFGGGSGSTTKLITLTSEWQRVDVTATLSGGTNTAIYIADFSSSGNANSFYCYAVQLEAGSYVSSYIPTYSVSSTRVADSCSKTGISELIGQTEGTFFAEFEHNGFNGAISQNAIYTRAASSTSNYLYINVYNGRINIGLRVNSTTLFDTLQGPSPLSEGVHKCAFAYKSGDIVIYLDGQSIYVPSNNVYSNLSLAELGVGNNTTGGNQLGDGLKQVIVFKTRLSNDELAELTKL